MQLILQLQHEVDYYHIEELYNLLNNLLDYFFQQQLKFFQIDLIFDHLF